MLNVTINWVLYQYGIYQVLGSQATPGTAMINADRGNPKEVRGR